MRAPSKPRTADEAILRATELLEHATREACARKRGERGRLARAFRAVLAGSRRMLDIVDVPVETGSIGIAKDISELEAIRADLERQMQVACAHARPIVDRRRHFRPHASGWSSTMPPIASSGRSTRPSSTSTRAMPKFSTGCAPPRNCPSRPISAAGRTSLLAAYHSLETVEQVWYLPDGRTLRVVINPNPQGGVTYLFDDVSERFHLESQFNALTYVQSETLDTLKEGVAVFGTDGRLKFYNPAFASLWKIDSADARRPAAYRQGGALVHGARHRRTGLRRDPRRSSPA